MLERLSIIFSGVGAPKPFEVLHKMPANEKATSHDSRLEYKIGELTASTTTKRFAFSQPMRSRKVVYTRARLAAQGECMMDAWTDFGPSSYSNDWNFPQLTSELGNFYILAAIDNGIPGQVTLSWGQSKSPPSMEQVASVDESVLEYLIRNCDHFKVFHRKTEMMAGLCQRTIRPQVLRSNDELDAMVDCSSLHRLSSLHRSLLESTILRIMDQRYNGDYWQSLHYLLSLTSKWRDIGNLDSGGRRIAADFTLAMEVHSHLLQLYQEKVALRAPPPTFTLNQENLLEQWNSEDFKWLTSGWGAGSPNQPEFQSFEPGTAQP